MSPNQADLLKGTASFVEGRVPADSIFAFLHRECHVLFPDEMFEDLYSGRGRQAVPGRILAVVMVLQKMYGLSDREAVAAFEFDTRWKYAAGGLDFDYPGFVHTVLVNMRARLAASDDEQRIFKVSLRAANRAGLLSARRVLDSTPLYDAVATMDTVTLIRSASRGLLAVADFVLGGELRGVLVRDDTYINAGKPVCDWDDTDERRCLVDALARDGHACLGVLDGRALDPKVCVAAELLATVLGQDLDQDDRSGVFRIARRVAKDRVISTVDPTARHGHKTAARGFDGHKGHVGIDPDSEIITATKVTAGNVSDGAVAQDLIEDLLNNSATPDPTKDTAGRGDPEVLGDAAYGNGKFQEFLEDNAITSGCKTPPPSPLPGGRFTKDRFGIDLETETVTCPNGVTVTIKRHRDGTGTAEFNKSCSTCPLRDQCTRSPKGRKVNIGVHEAALVRARARQQDPEWKANYQATRPKVERKLGHMMRRRHGARRSRVRGTTKIDADFNLLAGALNLARLAVLGIYSTPASGWATTN